MMYRTRDARRGGDLCDERRGAVSILFATAAIPMTMCVGLAVDFSFYLQAQSQLTLAADAGAIHAVRVASAHFVQGESAAAAGADGAASGLQWFNAQLGPLSTGLLTPANVTVPQVAYDAASSTFTSTVTYKATIPTHFGNLFNAVLSWPLTGTSNAAITTNSFVQIDIMADNSSSMLIGAEPSDIEALQNLTLCPPTSVAAATLHGGNSSGYTEYSWNFPGNNVYGLARNQTVPTASNPAPPGGSCDPNFTGDVGGVTGTYMNDAGECLNPTALKGTIVNLPETNLPPGIAPPLDTAGFCPPGYGVPDGNSRKDPVTGNVGNLPQSPCGFACHGNYTPNDYYTLLQTARAKGAIINLRFDVIQNAMAQVVQNMQVAQQKSGVPNQFTLGVFTFNSAINQVHPQTGGGFVEADSALAQGLTDIQGIQAPAVVDQANTDFPDAMAYFTSKVQPGGDGTTPAAPRKNLFIVTDGLEDYSPANRYIGQMTNPLNETTCAALKAKNFAIYVLYTPYYPLPNPFYLNNGARLAVEAPITNPSLSIAAALKACASQPSYYYQASSVADINSAMQQMLASALNSPGRITH